MERTSTANDLTERLRRRLESERREIEELTASELERLGENSRRVARNALRSIERDTEEATGMVRELLAKAWQRPLIVGLSLWLGFFGGSWATMQWLSRSIQTRIETVAGLGRDIEDARRTLAQHSQSGADTVVTIELMESAGAIPANLFPMEWTPPPGGIAMCQDGTEAIATLRGLTI